MRLEVIGCYGGEVAGKRSCSLLLDGEVLLDAGSFGTSLSLRRQLAINHVLISHAHCDHIKDLAGLADMAIGHRKEPVQLHATEGVIDDLKRHFFNNRLWPDFFSLPSPLSPVFKAEAIAPGKWFKVGHLRVMAHRVAHPVECVGFVVRSGTGSFVYSGDTGPTDALWKAVNRLRDVKLILVETKFPNSMQMVADAAGHLTPKTLAGELEKIRFDDVPVLVYHMKPDCLPELQRQVKAIGDGRVGFLRQGQVLEV